MSLTRFEVAALTFSWTLCLDSTFDWLVMGRSPMWALLYFAAGLFVLAAAKMFGGSECR